MTTDPRARDIPLLGACLELGAAARGTLMGPQALRTAGLVRVLADLGHRVADRGTLARGRARAGRDGRRATPSAAATSARSPAGRGALHDRAYAMAAEARRAGLPRRRPRHLDGHDQRRRPRLRRGRAASSSCSGSTPTPTTTRPRPRRRGNMHGMALAFLAGEPSLRADPRRAGRSTPVPPPNIHVFGARSIDPDEKRAARAPHGVDAVDMRAIDERGVSALLAERIAGWRARGVAPARQLRRRLPRPRGRARHRHRGAGRRHLPRGASGHGDALRQRARRLGRRGRAQPLPRRARPHAPSSPPSWSRASSAAPCSTASPGAVAAA